jgi:multimeric flavodoxin WrbA
MKILAINGSHRGEKGFTQFLIDKVFEGAQNAGAECDTIVLAKLNINHCLACDTCHTPEHFLKCVYEGKDDVKSIFDKIIEADILIYATPTYIFSMSGLMKTFLDRFYGTADVNEIKLSKSGLIFHHIDNRLLSKPFAVITCCNGMENELTKNTVSYFRTFSKLNDAKLLGILVRNGGQLVQHGTDPLMERRFPKLTDVYNAYIQAGRELVVHGSISKSTLNKANQEILPIPLFSLLKHLKPVKQRCVIEANKLIGNNR